MYHFKKALGYNYQWSVCSLDLKIFIKFCAIFHLVLISGMCKHPRKCWKAGNSF